MCRNLATLVIGAHKESPAASRGGIAELARRALRTSRGRGCRWCYLAYERLPAIIDPALSVRPLSSGTEDIMVAVSLSHSSQVNGETIYSIKQLKYPMEPHWHRTQSDCDFDAHLYEDGGEEVVGIMELAGARMRLALKPHDCERFEVFPPGQMFSSKVEGIAETPTHLGSQPHVLQTECADHHEIIECSFYVSRPYEQAGSAAQKSLSRLSVASGRYETRPGVSPTEWHCKVAAERPGPCFLSIGYVSQAGAGCIDVTSGHQLKRAGPQ